MKNDRDNYGFQNLLEDRERFVVASTRKNRDLGKEAFLSRGVYSSTFFFVLLMKKLLYERKRKDIEEKKRKQKRGEKNFSGYGTAPITSSDFDITLLNFICTCIILIVLSSR